MNEEATKAVRVAMQEIAQRQTAQTIYVPFGDAEQVLLHLERNGFQVIQAEPNEAWLVFFEDPSRGFETFVGADAEGAARRFYEQASQSWNCTLFRAVSPEIDRHTVRR